MTVDVLHCDLVTTVMTPTQKYPEIAWQRKLGQVLLRISVFPLWCLWTMCLIGFVCWYADFFVSPERWPHSETENLRAVRDGLIFLCALRTSFWPTKCFTKWLFGKINTQQLIIAMERSVEENENHNLSEGKANDGHECQ